MVCALNTIDCVLLRTSTMPKPTLAAKPNESHLFRWFDLFGWLEKHTQNDFNDINEKCYQANGQANVTNISTTEMHFIAWRNDRWWIVDVINIWLHVRGPADECEWFDWSKMQMASKCNRLKWRQRKIWKRNIELQLLSKVAFNRNWLDFSAFVGMPREWSKINENAWIKMRR